MKSFLNTRIAARTGTFAFCVTAAVLSTAVQAENAQSGPWKGELEFGLVNTSGNSKTSSVFADAGVTYQLNPWKHELKVELLNSSNDAGTTAERYLVSGKSDYLFSERNYLFGLIKWEKDRFLGYDYQLNEVVGVGRQLISGTPVQLDAEVGAGARQTELRAGGSENETIVRLAANLNWDWTDTSHFREELSSEIGESTVTRSVTSVTAKINSTLALKAALMVKHTSEVPVGAKKTDTETAVTLVYGF